MPIWEVVHSFIKYAQRRDVFIMGFLHVIHLAKVELFCFYTDPFSNFDDPLFNDFTKLLPVQWCSNLIQPQAFLGFNIGGQIFVVHIWNLVDGSWMKGS
jgi:hypothetical protein